MRYNLFTFKGISGLVGGNVPNTLPPTRLHVYKLYLICTYKRLPEDEPSGSKHLDDIVKIKVLV